MDLLTQLAQVYGTDKWGVHAYTPFYYELFEHKKVMKLLEIGVLAGASLRMWQAFFPTAYIDGIDNNPNHLCKEGRIRTFQLDQRNAKDLEALADLFSPWDIIIDDGSHEPEDQAFTANILIPYVRPGGFYIIEDIRQGNKEKVQAAINFPTRVVEFKIETQTDDRLIVCER